MNILSVDAWAEPEGGWTWNNWWKVGNISAEKFKELDTNHKILKWFRTELFLGTGSVGKCGVEDDGYNIVIVDRGNRMPIYAIEYGTEYSLGQYEKETA